MAHGKLIVITFLVFFFVGCKSHSPRTAPLELYQYPGAQWLSWTPAERENYVLGYIQGHGEGSGEACMAADHLFELDKPHSFGHGNVTSTFPSSRCLASVDEYPNVNVSLSTGMDFSAYTDVITEFYTNHPEYRGMPYSQVMTYLAGVKHKTANDVYSTLTTWKSAAPPQ